MNKLHYKTCWKCQIEKHTSEFYRYAKNNCTHKMCKSCKDEKDKLIRNKELKCSKCNQIKSHDNFYKHNRLHGSGFYSRCKVCLNEDNAEYAESNPDIIKGIQKRNRNKYRDMTNATRRIYRRIHKFQVMADNANLSAKKKSSGETITAFDLWKIAKRQKLICPISGKKLNIDNISLDHKIAFKNNGKNTIDNLQLVDNDINTMKLDHPTEDFLNLIKTIYLFNFSPIPNQLIPSAIQ